MSPRAAVPDPRTGFAPTSEAARRPAQHLATRKYVPSTLFFCILLEPCVSASRCAPAQSPKPASLETFPKRVVREPHAHIS